MRSISLKLLFNNWHRKLLLITSNIDVNCIALIKFTIKYA